MRFSHPQSDRLFATQQDGLIGATWAGGLAGMKVTDIVLDMLHVRQSFSYISKVYRMRSLVLVSGHP